MNEKILLDWGTKIGVVARKEGVQRDQLESLIASLDYFDVKESLLSTAIITFKKWGELRLGRETARLIAQAMLDLYEKGGGKEEAKKLLGFAKWVFDATRFNVATYVRDARNITLVELLKMLC